MFEIFQSKAGRTDSQLAGAADKMPDLIQTSARAALDFERSRNYGTNKELRIVSNSKTVDSILQTLDAFENDLEGQILVRVVLTYRPRKAELARLMNAVGRFNGFDELEQSVRINGVRGIDRLGSFVHFGGANLWMRTESNTDSDWRHTVVNNPMDPENVESLKLFEFLWRMSDAYQTPN